MVNLEWVRAVYFQELQRQLGTMGGPHGGLRVTMADDRGRPVIPASDRRTLGQTARRSLSLLFVDPLLVALDPPADLPRRDWTMEVGVREDDPSLGAAPGFGQSSVATSALAAAVLALGLAMTSRAARASARVAEMRSDFVATVTHELKTPLATIRAIGDTVSSGRVSHRERLREYGQLIVQESKRLERLVDNSLAYARVTDVAQVYHFASLDVRELVDEALNGFATPITMMGFDVQVNVPADLDPVHGDRTAMGLVLDNVIDNAIRYSGETRSLQISAASDREGVALTIADRGIGIPRHEVPFVARKFFRGRGAGSGGSGLGLAIVRRIVSDHGGRLRIASELGSGTTVTLVLPRAREGDA
jgi:signal transduction histidine kinase